MHVCMRVCHLSMWIARLIMLRASIAPVLIPAIFVGKRTNVVYLERTFWTIVLITQEMQCLSLNWSRSFDNGRTQFGKTKIYNHANVNRVTAHYDNNNSKHRTWGTWFAINKEIWLIHGLILILYILDLMSSINEYTVIHPFVLRVCKYADVIRLIISINTGMLWFDWYL